MHVDFGVGGTAIIWLHSFTTERFQYVCYICTVCSSCVPVRCTARKCRAYWAILFAIYISPVGNVVAAHSVHCHQYADDNKLCMAFQPNNGSATLSAVSDCVADVSWWFLENGDGGCCVRHTSTNGQD